MSKQKKIQCYKLLEGKIQVTQGQISNMGEWVIKNGQNNKVCCYMYWTLK